ncbi:MAG: hypothetical protein V1870_03405 [Candidatus Aenigmatarchaeota archaeon]
MNLPNIDLEELKKDREKNHAERMKFIDMYTDWLKKTPNEIWSKQHANFIDSGITIVNSRIINKKSEKI